MCVLFFFFFFFQAEDGIRDKLVTGVQTCALPIWSDPDHPWFSSGLPHPSEKQEGGGVGRLFGARCRTERVSREVGGGTSGGPPAAAALEAFVRRSPLPAHAVCYQVTVLMD